MEVLLVIQQRALIIGAFAVGLMLSACTTTSEKSSQMAQVSANDERVVQIEGGLVRGVVRNGAVEFRGIPFAAAPAGELRWAPPQPAAPWKGVRDASEFGPACPQVARFGLTEASDDEDCLSINVSIPAHFDRKSGEKLPVLFWIHGGAFVGGGSSLYRLDQLARDGGIIVVTANYRLGVFGWLPHPAFDAKTSGAYGLLDQREALRWVQRNIASFGGDPGNVTLSGESAGGGSTCQHLITPEESKGLFHKALIMSAACLQPLQRVEDVYPVARKFSEAVGCTDPKTELACLRRAPLAKILEVQTHLAGTTTMAYGPTVGSQVLPLSVADAVESGKIMKVPLMMGGAKDEVRLYVGYDHQAGRPVTRENFVAHIRKVYGATDGEQKRKVPEKVAKQYRLGKNDVAPEVFGSMLSDFNPEIGINNCMYLKTGTSFMKSMPVYQFEFDDPDALVLGVGIPAEPDPGFKMGSVHSAALNYVFPHYSNTSRIDAPALEPQSQKLSETMVAYWASFARSGVPSADGAPTWALFNGKDTVQLLKPGQVDPYDAGKAHKCGFWKALYPEFL